MKHYRQLNQEERYQIGALQELGQSNASIARHLGRSASTISRELTRNRRVNGYQPATAQRLSDRRRRTADKASKRIPELIDWVSCRLKDKWSPEQISGTARAAGYRLIRHEWIYQLVLRDKAAGGELAQHLRHRQRRYRRRYSMQDRRGKIPSRVGIKVSRSTAALTREAMVDILSLVDRRHTVTLDNGSEFSHHEQVSAAVGCRIYFARPYHSWERGANENVNGLIRQYFPKQTNFDSVTNEQIQAVEQAINMRPRKRLGYKAPIELI